MRIDDATTCTVCFERLWRPWLYVPVYLHHFDGCKLVILVSLPCGHVNCKSCLEAVFHRTLEDHMRRHPNYNYRHLNEFRAVLRHWPDPEAHEAIRRHAHSEIGIMEGTQSHPQFTCPECWAVVDSPLIEVHSLKDVAVFAAIVKGGNLPDASSLTSSTDTAREAFDAFFPCQKPHT